MLYLCHRPGPPLNEFIDYLWLLDGGQSPRLEKILPCGTGELVVNLKQNAIHIHDPNQPESYRRFSGAVCSGTYSRPFLCDALQHEAIIGVHFKPGGALPFLNVEAGELGDSHVDLADLWGRDGVELQERLCAAATHQARFRTMENVLRDRLRQHETDQLELSSALRMFAMNNRVRDVARELGLSQRRFIEMFRARIGLAPKLFCRILRFQRARILAERFNAPDWASLAVACGYFDQSHLIRDFKEFSGSTPRIYSMQQHHKDDRFKENHVPFAA